MWTVSVFALKLGLAACLGFDLAAAESHVQSSGRLFRWCLRPEVTWHMAVCGSWGLTTRCPLSSKNVMSSLWPQWGTQEWDPDAPQLFMCHCRCMCKPHTYWAGIEVTTAGTASSSSRLPVFRSSLWTTSLAKWLSRRNCASRLFFQRSKCLGKDTLLWLIYSMWQINKKVLLCSACWDWDDCYGGK